jgi:hypothetical protein
MAMLSPLEAVGPATSAFVAGMLLATVATDEPEGEEAEVLVAAEAAPEVASAATDRPEKAIRPPGKAERLWLLLLLLLWLCGLKYKERDNERGRSSAKRDFLLKAVAAAAVCLWLQAEADTWSWSWVCGDVVCRWASGRAREREVDAEEADEVEAEAAGAAAEVEERRCDKLERRGRLFDTEAEHTRETLLLSTSLSPPTAPATQLVL